MRTPGRPPKLKPEQEKRLVSLLNKRPIEYGYRTGIWTQARIAEVIERKFGVHYHRDHIVRLMRRLNRNFSQALIM